MGSSGAAATAAGPLPDPKDRIGAFEDFKRGLSLRLAGDRAEAVAQFRKVVGANPDMRDAWEMLGITLLEMDRRQEAIAAFDRTIALDPARPGPHLELAGIYAPRRPAGAGRHARRGGGLARAGQRLRDPGPGDARPRPPRSRRRLRPPQPGPPTASA